MRIFRTKVNLMKKSVLFSALLLLLLGMGLLYNSCVKKDTQLRLAFSVDSIMQNVYVGDTGYTDWILRCSFLSGNPQEKVTLTINGLPQRLTVTPDSVTATPTFTQDFVFHGNYAPRGSYPANLVAYSPSTGNKVYNFNLVVVSANCALGMDGTYTGTNMCNTANITYPCTITHTGNYTINIVNLGGYGTSSTTHVAVNCNVDSLTIAKQADGNGDTLQGVGTFTTNQMIIYYTKKTATGGFDSCVATLNKQ